jgi:uncharacterized protein
MKTLRVCAVVVCIIVGAIGCGQATTQTSAADAGPAVGVSPVDVATEMVASLARGDMAAATARFDAKMQAAMPSAQLASTWDGLLAQAGAFKEQVKTRTEKVQGFDVVFVTCAFERAMLDLQVTVDGMGQVSGFFVRPAT